MTETIDFTDEQKKLLLDMKLSNNEPIGVYLKAANIEEKVYFDLVKQGFYNGEQVTDKKLIEKACLVVSSFETVVQKFFYNIWFPIENVSFKSIVLFCGVFFTCFLTLLSSWLKGKKIKTIPSKKVLFKTIE